jgi:hypothetical protein
MSYVNLNLPTQAKVLGALRKTDVLHDLNEDMLQIELPGDVFVDVGWYPDWDPNGEYRLKVFHDTVDSQLEPQFCSRDVNAVEATIYYLVAKYLRSVQAIGTGGSEISRSLNGKASSHAEREVNVVAAASALRFSFAI